MKKEILSKEAYIRPNLKRIAMFGKTGILVDTFSIITTGDEEIHTGTEADDDDDDNRAPRFNVWEIW